GNARPSDRALSALGGAISSRREWARRFYRWARLSPLAWRLEKSQVCRAPRRIEQIRVRSVQRYRLRPERLLAMEREQTGNARVCGSLFQIPKGRRLSRYGSAASPSLS